MRCVSISRARCTTLSTEGVLSVLQQQLDAPLAEKDDPPAPRPMPENRIAAGGNQFARPAEAREPATRFSITPSREPAASSGKPGGASWPHAQPGYQKQQGALYRQLLDTPTAPKPALQPPAAAELAGHSQSFGRVLTIVGGDCALLEREGGLALLSLTVAERWLRRGAVDPGSGGGMCSAAADPAAVKSYGRGKAGAGRRSAGAGAARGSMCIPMPCT